MDWTEEQIQALAPNAFSLRRAQALASLACWTTLGKSATGAWGTQVLEGHTVETGLDLASLTHTCACQRLGGRAVCAHSMGLQLLLRRQPAAFAREVPPAWFTTWQTQPAATAPDAAAAAEYWDYPSPWSVQLALQHPHTPALLAQQQRRVAALASWLRALLTRGLQHAPPGEMPYSRPGLSPWQKQEFTLLSWELPGLAEAVRTLAGQCGSELTEAAQDDLLVGLGKLYQLAQAFLRWAHLSPAEQQSVSLRAGLPFLDRTKVRVQQPAVADTWHVLAQHSAPEMLWGGSWQQRRTWLWGPATGRYALVLEMQWNHTPFSTELEPAGSYPGRLVFYPAPEQWRAVPAADWPAAALVAQWPAWPPGIRLAELPLGYLSARAQQPWLAEWPVTLEPVVPLVSSAGEVCLYDAATQRRLPLRGTPVAQWQLVASSGGQPLAVFGEWDGHGLLPRAHWLASTTTSACP